jgi:hypothetical protein
MKPVGSEARKDKFFALVKRFNQRIAAMLALRGRGHFDDADVTDAVSPIPAAGGAKSPNDAIISVGETVGVASLG